MKTMTLRTTGRGYYTQGGQVKGYFALPLGDHPFRDEFEYVELPEGSTPPAIVPEFVPDETEILIAQKSADLLREQAVDALIFEGKLPANTPKKVVVNDTK